MKKSPLQTEILLAITVAIMTAGCCLAEFVKDDKVPPLEQRTLRLRLQAFKSEYIKFESIPIVYWLENVGDQLQYYRESEIEGLDVRDNSGKPAPRCGFKSAPLEGISVRLADGGFASDWSVLRPGESTEKQLVDVLTQHGIGENFYCFYLPSGQYVIRGRLVRSDTLCIVVAEPTSSEEIAAGSLFERAITAHRMRPPLAEGEAPMWLPDYEEQGRLFREFSERYPQSPYVPRALQHLISESIWGKQPSSSVIPGYALRLVTDWPYSSQIQTGLAYLDPSKVTPEEKTSLKRALLRISEIHPATRDVTKPVQELLRKLKN